MARATEWCRPWDHRCSNCGHGLEYHPPPKGKRDPTPDGKCRVPGCPCMTPLTEP